MAETEGLEVQITMAETREQRRQQRIAETLKALKETYFFPPEEAERLFRQETLAQTEVVDNTGDLSPEEAKRQSKRSPLAQELIEEEVDHTGYKSLEEVEEEARKEALAKELEKVLTYSRWSLFPVKDFVSAQIAANPDNTGLLPGLLKSYSPWIWDKDKEKALAVINDFKASKQRV